MTKPTDAPPADIVERLSAHEVVGRAPGSEIEWLAAHGWLRRVEAGNWVAQKGEVIGEIDMGLEIVLAGRMANYRDRGAGPKKVITWEAGEVTGLLPFSRMHTMVGDTGAEEDTETWSIPLEHHPEMIRECPTLTAIFVHRMLDRARVFNTSEWQDEKLVSLGRLSAGLAHEINNPASAVVRSAAVLPEAMAEAERAARALAAAGPTPEQLKAIDWIRGICMAQPPKVSMSPLERADREDLLADWLRDHGADLSALDSLVETAVTVEALDEFAEALQGPALDAALDWVAAGCTVRSLASTAERAAVRITDLVTAMKRMTHMDQARTWEPMDLEAGVRDTMLVLGHRARDKSVSLKVEVEDELPETRGVAGEINQVWMNLVGNAVDAVDDGGEVSVHIGREGDDWVAVRVIDNGSGISEEAQARIFDPFFTTKKQGQGTGLGLQIARTRVNEHGGTIDFESEPGRTEFRVRLPVGGGGLGPASEGTS
jgi:signal transduction histidine kinase